MGSREWTYWLVFMEVYPWSDDWEQTALIAWSGVAPHSKRSLKIEEFLPTEMRANMTATNRMTPEQIKAVLLGRR